MGLKPGYKQTEVGVIPEEWEARTLPDACWFQEGPGLRQWQFTKSGMKVINVTNLEGGVLNLDRTDRHISMQEFTRMYQHFAIDAGDIVMASSGNSYSKTAVVRDQDLPLMMNTSVIRFKVARAAEYGFLWALLNCWIFKDQIDLMITGGAQPNFGPYHLNRVFVPLPPLPEQRAIAAALSHVDALIDSLDQLIAKKRDLKQVAMQQLLTGQHRLPGFDEGKVGYEQTELGAIPRDWEPIPLERISAFITKGATPTTYGFAWRDDGVLFLRSECVSEQGLDLSQSMFIAPEAHKILGRSEVRAGDILMTITGNVGRVIRLGDDFGTANINQHIARIRIVDEGNSAEFVYHFLSQPSIRRRYGLITTGQAYPQISLKQVRDTKVPLPSFAEQTAIAAVLSDMDAEIAALEARRDKTRALKQGMMQELLTGRIRLV